MKIGKLIKQFHKSMFIKNNNNKMEIDSHKLMYHPKRVVKWSEKGDCYPLYVEIGPTNRCNHRCVFCCYDFFVNKNLESIDREVMLKNLKDMSEKGVKAVMFAGDGEPFLHKDICEFVEKSKEYNMDVSMTSNGAPLTQEKIERCLPNLSWIRFSVDAGTPETHSKIHGTQIGDFERIINNIRNAVKFKKENNLDVTIGVQFLLIPQNVSEILKLAKILKEIGVDNMQVKPYSQHPGSVNHFVINYEEYAHLEPELKKFNSENFNIFFRKQTMKRIDEGNVYPECYGLSYFNRCKRKCNSLWNFL